VFDERSKGQTPGEKDFKPPGGPPGHESKEPVEFETLYTENNDPELDLIRIGYSTPTPIHCAMGEILLRTDILAKHGFRGEFIPLERGRDQHAAGRQGLLDATFTCEAPAIDHLHQLPDLALVGTPGRIGEIALVVPAESHVREVRDLDGSSVVYLGGSSSALVLEQWLIEAVPGELISVRSSETRGNGDPAIEAMMAGSAAAAVLWDPWLAHHMAHNELRIVARAPIWSALAIHRPHMTDEALQRYLAAVHDALLYGEQNLDEVAGWVHERGGVPLPAVRAALGKNEFLGGSADPDLEMTEEQLQRLENAGHRAILEGRIPSTFRLDERIEDDAGDSLPTERRDGDGSVPNDLVRIPGGEFSMGALDRDRQARDCEYPRHRVTLSGFHIQEHEVTVAEYMDAVQAGIVGVPGCSTKEAAEEWYCNWDVSGRALHPVNGVSWYEANRYCAWIGMRLPTEAEFEYVLAGGEDDAIFPWGGDDSRPPDTFGNFVDEATPVPIQHWTPVAGRADGFGGTAPVRTFPPNAYGVFDIAGNIWEWTYDWFGSSSYSKEPQVDPTGPATGTHRTMRGGGFACYLEETRIAERHHKAPDNEAIYVGFRCAKSME